MEKTRDKKWYENDLFWKTFGSEMFNNDVLERTVSEVDNIIELLGLQPDSNILDLCCGIGRHSLELARRGFKVSGFDRTAAYLEQAKQQADIEGLDVDFVQGDMRRFCALDEFNAVINMYTAFGYFEDQADDRRVLLNAFASLKKGGKLLVQTMSKEVLARIFQPRDWHETDGIKFLRESKVTNGWSWVENRWILLNGDGQKEYKFGHRIYSAVEFSDLLKKTGFRKVDVYGNLSAIPYDHEAKCLVLIAEK